MAQGMNALFPLENEGEIAALYCDVILLIFAQGGGIWSEDDPGRSAK